MSNELGRLSQGFGEIKENNTFFFIPKNNAPKGKAATYIRTVCAIKPHKTETTAGGNRIFYAGEKPHPSHLLKPSKCIGTLQFLPMVQNI